MENILSNFQCDFRKGFNAQQCLTDMIEKAKGIMDEGWYFSALLTDLSKAFDHLNNRKQRVKINSSFSSFQNIISGVPQGSIMGRLLFNIFLTNIFIFCPTEIASYVDDNTPYATEDCLKKAL